MPLKLDRIAQITDSMGKGRILILGDIMLDEYMFGSVNRISPEAPVPVVEIDSSRLLLGGAANVAANVRSLGVEPILVGTMGDDDASTKLKRLLAEKSISSDFILFDETRQTTIKTRIMAHGQQVVRADREDRHELNEEMEGRVMNRLHELIDDIDAVLISDYGKGLITRSLLESVVGLCLSRDRFVGVDPKETHFRNYKQVSVITPNHHEAGFAFGRRIQTEEDLNAVGNGLLKQLQARSILVTRGAEGMSLFQRDHKPIHIPTFARQVYDVTGAGDTVIATFVSAVCAGADLVEAAMVANAAAGLTVREVGTATVTPYQIRAELELNFRNGTLVTAGNVAAS